MKPTRAVTTYGVGREILRQIPYNNKRRLIRDEPIRPRSRLTRFVKALKFFEAIKIFKISDVIASMTATLSFFDDSIPIKIQTEKVRKLDKTTDNPAKPNRQSVYKLITPIY